VSGYDVMRAVLECRRRFGARRIGAVGAYHMLYGVSSIKELLGIEVVFAPVENEDEAETAVRRLKEAGVGVVIGGFMSTEIAAAAGLETVFIESGREAVYQALAEARRVAAVRRLEQAKSELFRTVLDYSAEGIVAVDSEGRISLINAAATRLAGLNEGVLGRPADEVFPQLRLGKILALGRAVLGEIETFAGQQVAVNVVPIVVQEQSMGAVATIQPVAAIQELEGKIRRKMHRRGHIARFTFNDVLCESPAMRQTVALARECSQVDSNVLIVGETGTGKEVFAQSIHNASRRAQGPFVAVNCAALPENLLESELFGYVEGAFTGAARGGKMGLFEQAHRGTIFLDEVSEISPKLQGRLLRVLQEREIMRLGDDRVIPVDVRVIAATNRDLFRLIETGEFRPDLYYRLDILKVAIPPLRERREDVLPLLEHFLRLNCLRHSRPPKILADDAKAVLVAYAWPGNVRELRNLAERLAVLGGREGAVTAADVLAALPGEALSAAPAIRRSGAAAAAEERELPGRLDRETVLKVLAKTKYHYGRAAALLGVSRTTLWRWLKRLDLKDEAGETN